MSNDNRLSRQDFISDQEVKWCKGCGDYNVLRAVQGVLADTGKSKEETVFVSGIGCSSRFPYYLDTYGFHTIHGRAPSIATGVKASNPKLDVWVITGDGDALSIGTNHFIHTIRRNVDVKILLFNNAIYGLTKGQFSPTTPKGSQSRSDPYLTQDQPLSPLALAASVDGTFLARTSDNDMKHMKETLTAAANHKGTAVVEILQNCVVFNDKVHDPYNGVKQRDENLLYLQEGQALRYGKAQTQLLDFVSGRLAKVETASKVHTLNTHDLNYVFALTQLSFPDGPIPVGVFRSIERPTFDDQFQYRVEQKTSHGGMTSLKAVMMDNAQYRLV